MAQEYLTALTKRVYWSPPDSVRDRPVLGAVAGERGTLVVDAGASPGHASQLQAALKRLDAAPARFVALTHWHWDHVFGASFWDLPILAHRETRRQVIEMSQFDWSDAGLEAGLAAGTLKHFTVEHLRAEMTDAERRTLVVTPPDVIFDSLVEVDLGGVTAQIIHVGGDHSPDSSVVYIPEEGIVFLGDCLYSGPVGEEYYYTTGRLFPLLDQLLDLDARVYLPAHQEMPLSRAELELQAGMLRKVGAAVERSGGDRQAALLDLEQAFGAPLDEDQLDALTDFLRGLQGDV